MPKYTKINVHIGGSLGHYTIILTSCTGNLLLVQAVAVMPEITVVVSVFLHIFLYLQQFE